MASDTRSKHGKKGQEPAAEENLVPLALEVASPIGLETLVQYLLQNTKSSDEARRQEAEEAERKAEAKEERDEKRRKQDLIEAEERSERRRKQELIDAEERQEKREARQLVLKQEAERELREEKRKQQLEDEKRAFTQQQEMMRYQAEMGGKADDARKAEFDKSRARDKAMAGILVYKDPEDVEEYMESAEKLLIPSGIPEGEWGGIMASKMKGRVGSAWADLQVEGATFKSMKARLLASCGYTPKHAGEQFFNFKQENIKGMTPDHLWRRGVQLLRRLVAPLKLEPGAEFAIVKAWIWAVLPRRARTLLDSRTVTTHSELTLALQDYLECEGEKGEGEVAVFRRQHQGSEHSSSGNNERRPVGTCYRCGKPGHKVADCWQKVGNGNGSESAKPSAGGPAKTIICFTCGVEGHRSPQCPKKGQSKPKEGQGQAKPVRKLCTKLRKTPL